MSIRRKSDIGSDDNPMSRNAASSGDEQGRRTEAGDGQESKGSKIKKYTEAEILADDDLWEVTDSDEEATKSYSNNKAGELQKSKTFTEPNHDKESQDSQAQIKAKSGKHDKKYNLKHRNPNWYDDNQMLRDEENMMARFLVEKAPSLKGFNDDTFNEMDRRTNNKNGIEQKLQDECQRIIDMINHKKHFEMDAEIEESYKLNQEEQQTTTPPVTNQLRQMLTEQQNM